VGPLEPSRRDRQYPTELLRMSYGYPTDHPPTSWLALGLCPSCTWLAPGLRMAPVATAFTKSRVLAKLRADVARAQHCSPSVIHCASTELVRLADLRGSIWMSCAASSARL